MHLFRSIGSRSMPGFPALLLLLTQGVLLAQPAGGLTWRMPAEWKAQPARPMRAATYAIAPAPGDTDAAECGIFFFGAGQGGSVEDNIERWRSQIVGPDGKPAVSKIDKRVARGLNVTMVDSSGAYTGMGGPMTASSRAVPGYRLLGAVIQGSGGNNIFVKFTGPAKTIAANQAKFEELLSSFQPQK
jgi:hypothetical protein